MLGSIIEECDKELLKTYFFLYSLDYLLNYSLVTYSPDIENAIDEVTLKIMNFFQERG